MSDYNRQQRYQTAEDPDSDNADTYPASKTKNPRNSVSKKQWENLVNLQFQENLLKDLGQ